MIFGENGIIHVPSFRKRMPRQRANGLWGKGLAVSSGGSSVGTGKASFGQSVRMLVRFAPIMKQAVAVATGSSSDT